MPHVDFEITPFTNIRELVAALPIAADVLRLRPGLLRLRVNTYETIEQAPPLTACASSRSSRRSRKRVSPAASRRSATKTARPQRRAPGRLRAAARKIRARRPGHVRQRRRRQIAGRPRCWPSACARRHMRVGILDADITGPSIPRLFGLHDAARDRKPTPTQDAAGQAAAADGPGGHAHAIEVVSSNLLTDEEDTAMIWRGPILSGVIRHSTNRCSWSDLDVLLIDLPPGTSDAPLTVLQSLPIDGVVLVTMPQALATMIVRKAANLVHQLKKPILGVVENMSYFVAPDTGTRYDIFGPSYADQVAEFAQRAAPGAHCRSIRAWSSSPTRAGRRDRRPDLRRTRARLLASLAAHAKPKETISIILAPPKRFGRSSTELEVDKIVPFRCASCCPSDDGWLVDRRRR